MEECFSGRRLYGDDFDPAEIEAWFEDEKEAFAELVSDGPAKYGSAYHAMHDLYGYRFLPPGPYDRVLGFGSADGEEFLPIISQVRRLDVIEPAQRFAREQIYGVPAAYRRPNVDGALPFDADVFDLITCFGVLHHIPNVTKVVGEFFRCLRPGGYALLQEPIRSMGDWRAVRPGLTKRERGIPVEIFRRIVRDSGFDVVRADLCQSSFLYSFESATGWAPYRSRAILVLDRFVCALLSRHTTYHPRNALEKIGPTAVAFVLRKPPDVGRGTRGPPPKGRNTRGPVGGSWRA